MAQVRLNGQFCSIHWTQPYRLNITGIIRQGDNLLEISVTNCWHNRLIRDYGLPVDKKLTWPTAPFRLYERPPMHAGLKGSVRICRKNDIVISLLYWQRTCISQFRLSLQSGNGRYQESNIIMYRMNH
jgi:hypothetical protein